MAAVSAVNSLGERAYNPRGNLWANDESTYGRKLLMKMGWSKGKGLGKNEDGIKENLSVKFRDANSGLGFKEDPYGNLMNTEYESILKNLSDCYSQTEASAAQKENKRETKSEQKSRIVGSKLRYPKLFYGKDVSKYSEKDMKSIFICSQPSKDNLKIPEDPIVHQKKESETELPKEVKTHSSTLSIAEYFAKKMKEKKKNLANEEQQPALDSKLTKKDISSTISGNKPKMNGINLEESGNQESTNISDLKEIETRLDISETENLSKKKSSSSKKKKKSPKDVSNNVAIEDFTYLGQHQLFIDPQFTKTDFLPSISKKKSKKNRINSEICLNEESRSHFDLQKTEKELELAGNLNLPENYSSKKEKSEISKADVSSHDTSECVVSKGKKRKLSEDLNCENNVSDICRKKRKSEIHTNGNCSVDLNIDLVANESKIPCQINLSDISLEQKEKLKRHHKERDIGIVEGVLPLKISQIPNEDHSLRLTEDENVICLKKKKKHKKLKLRKLKSCLKSKNGSYSLKNVSFNKVASYRIIDSFFDTVDLQPVASNSNQNNEVVDAELNDKNKVVDVVNEVKTESGNNRDVMNAAKTDSSDDTLISDVNKSCSDLEIEGEVSDKELKESCSLFNLPSQKSPHFNGWVESQRQALKMDLYKRMLKSIKKHEVLKSTNLLSIKGYGNWGFE